MEKVDCLVRNALNSGERRNAVPKMDDQAAWLTQDQATPRTAILRAAEAVFARGGFGAARMAEIAAAAGLPKANLHYYFGTKEKLYGAVLESILTEWLETADTWITSDRHPAEALAGYIRAKLAHARRRPEASRIFAAELLRGAPRVMSFLHGELRRRVARMASVMTCWAERGWMDAVDPAHLLFCIWAMTQTYADFDVQIRAVLDKPALDDAEFAGAEAMVTRMVVKGCGVRGRI
jgi:TetR/AcrR family transcriptional regulator